MFEGLSCLPGSYEIAIDHLVSLVKHAPRRIPVSIKTRVKEELDRLANLQAITTVKEPTEWISSMICIKKPNKLRICLDPKYLNKPIKRPNYPIPNIDDVLVKLYKAKFFWLLIVKMSFGKLN